MDFIEFWRTQPGHYCNQVIDPSTCCPCGHGEKDTRFCTCKVSPEMAKAVNTFYHELNLESWRQYDKITHKFILRNHRFEQANYVSCRQHHGAGPLKNGKCCFCDESIDWEVNLV